MCIRDSGYTAAFMHQACLWLEARSDEPALDDALARLSAGLGAAPVSYTHLDVYKRQGRSARGARR